MTIFKALEEENAILRQRIADLERLESFFLQSLDGFLMVILNEPIRWDETVDKEQVIAAVFAQQHCIKINDVLAAQYHAKREDFVGRSLDELFGRGLIGHDLEQSRLNWRQLFDKGQLHIEANERKLDGIPMWVEGDYVCLCDHQGRIEGVFGVQRDITARRLREGTLRTSEARYRSLFQQSHDAVFLADLKGRNLAINQRAADMFGYTVDEMMNITVQDTSVELDESLHVMDRLLAGEIIPAYERWYRKKDGQIFPVEINIELIRDQHGNPIYIQSIVRDITRRKLAEEALRSANQELIERMKEVERLQAELREQTLRDPLTGLYNRRYLSETMPREIARARRENMPLSIILCDIDNFKCINDTHSHHAGDKYLIELSYLLKSLTRDSDIVCRYGGEEFLLVLPGANQMTAFQRAEEIREKCFNTTVLYRGRKIRTSISSGVATYPEHGETIDEMIMRADTALYRSKNNGRNRVTVWNEQMAA